jgi:UDP-N-acetylmuramoylalanine--D-glutamate ligase
MIELRDKKVLVVGLDERGQAACHLLCRLGAKVFAIDPADSPDLRADAATLRSLGVEVTTGASDVPSRDFALAVLSPSVPLQSPLAQAALRRNLRLVSELELGAQQATCLTLAITGTNGKGTTAELVERILSANNRKTIVAGDRNRPVCLVADQTKELDFLILKANSFQLETAHQLCPAVAVLLNVAPNHLDRYAGADDYVRAIANVFRNQQAFDWAIIQSEALARLCELGISVPAKTITFSASDSKADLHLERGLLLSRLPNWSGPLLNMDHCLLRGPHNAENLMAALAVGHALRLPLESMLDPLRTCKPARHRFELVAEINGVQFINDSKATNPDALHKALLAARTVPGGHPNLWLIAGGEEKGWEYHSLGPLLASRVKRAFLIGEAGEKIRAAWSLFTPCTIARSLVEAVGEAAENATSGDVVLLSPACSSFDQFQDYQHRGEVFCKAVESISRGAVAGDPNINDKLATS